MKFYGDFTHVRVELDYSFHHMYDKERQLLQDDIVYHFLQQGSISNESELIIAAGAMGAGKTHVLRDILDGNGMLHKFVMADVDRIRYHLPEMKVLLKSDPENAGRILHSEACTIHEILFRQAIKEKRHVVIDGSLRDGEFFKRFLQDMARNPSMRPYKISIVHVLASLETCLRRAERRALITGRHIPAESIKRSLEECPRSVELIMNASNEHCVTYGIPLVDSVIVVENDLDDEPGSELSQ